MINMEDVIWVALIVAIFLIIIVGQVRIIYQRYFYKYKSEIIDYLQSNKLTYKGFHKPDNEEWRSSPFSKPERLVFKILFFSNNMLWKDSEYLIINTNENEIIWLEIITIYFKKPKLTFLFGEKPNKFSSEDISDSIIEVTKTCPACGFNITERDNKCPDCGLNFM